MSLPGDVVTRIWLITSLTLMVFEFKFAATTCFTMSFSVIIPFGSLFSETNKPPTPFSIIFLAASEIVELGVIVTGSLVIASITLIPVFIKMDKLRGYLKKCDILYIVVDYYFKVTNIERFINRELIITAMVQKYTHRKREETFSNYKEESEKTIVVPKIFPR